MMEHQTAINCDDVQPLYVSCGGTSARLDTGVGGPTGPEKQTGCRKYHDAATHKERYGSGAALYKKQCANCTLTGMVGCMFTHDRVRARALDLIARRMSLGLQHCGLRCKCAAIPVGSGIVCLGLPSSQFCIVADLPFCGPVYIARAPQAPVDDEDCHVTWRLPRRRPTTNNGSVDVEKR